MNDDFYYNLIENMADGVYFVDVNKRITFWSKGAEKITGYPKNEVMGSRCSENILRHIDDLGHELCLNGCPLNQTLIDGKIRECDVYLHHKNGYRVPVSVRISPIKDDEGQIVGAVEVFSDNSRKRLAILELEALRKEVFIDSLTQIGNRKFANLKLTHRLEEMQLHNLQFGVLFLDIDHFKKVNDTYGHLVGDKVLIMVTKTIYNILRGIDVLARWGGEEFIVIVTNIDRKELYKIAERIRVFLEKSWLTVNNNNIKVTVSIGGTIAINGDSIESIIERADRQLYKSKQSGRNRVTLDFALSFLEAKNVRN